MLGYGYDELPNDFSVWEALTDPEDVKRSWDMQQELIHKKRDRFELEFKMKHKDWHWVNILSRASAIFNADGQAVRIVGTHVDITERVSSREALRKAKLQAEAANQAKSEFLANMSHEIRTPLNGALGMLQLIQTTNLDAEQREYADAAIRASSRLTGLLSDILDFSKIEAGMMSLKEAEFDPGTFEKSIYELLIVAARKKGLYLKYTVDEKMPSVLIGDDVRVIQILFNLIGNAIKFTERGGIEVGVSPLPSSSNAQCRILFTVADSGIGMSDEQFKDIFEPFVQGDNSYARKYQGAGLGLAIVRRLTHLMRGEMAMESEPGHGTSVYLSLPFGLPAESGFANENPAKEHDKAKNSQTILVVEDDDLNRKSALLLLRKVGYDAQPASNGQDALQQLSQRDFDLLLMDIQMPVMDGLDAAKAIRAGKAGKNKKDIPIIAMTAYAMAGDREKFLAAGMNDYIAKPVIRDELLRAIVRALGK